MTAPPPVLVASPSLGPAALPPLRRFTVDEYHRLLEVGILYSGEKVELIDGYLVMKMTIHPPHMSSLQRARKRIERLLPDGWTARILGPITLATSEPEPDVAVARGDDDLYTARHPGPADLGLVVEVADSSLAFDQGVKARLYAAAGIAAYWIVDVVNRQVEVYALAGGGYGPPVVLVPGQVLPLVLGGVHLGDVPVADLFV